MCQPHGGFQLTRYNDIRLSPSDSVIFHELLKSLNTWCLCRWDGNSLMLLVALIQLQLESMLICYCWWLLRAAKSFEASNNERCSSCGDSERCVFVLPHEWGGYEKFQNERVHNELALCQRARMSLCRHIEEAWLELLNLKRQVYFCMKCNILWFLYLMLLR